MMSQRVLAWRTAIRGAARASNPGAARCVSSGASAARCVGGGGGRHVGTSRASNARAPWTAIVSPRSQRTPRRDVCAGAGAGAARGDAAERVTSTDNATVKHFAKLVKNRAHREQSGSVVVAGANLLEEIYGAPDGATLPEVKVMFLADDAPVPRGVPARRVVRAPEHVLKKAAGLQSVDRVDAVAELAAPNLDGAAALGTTDVTRLLALDGIQDPGNLGTLVRTALALGWDAVALLPGTCDPFNDKARPLRFPVVSRSPRTRARRAPVSRLFPEFLPPKLHDHCHAARLGSRPVAPRSSSSFRVLDGSSPPRPSLSALRARDAEHDGRGGNLSPAPPIPTSTLERPRRRLAEPITNVEPNFEADFDPRPSSSIRFRPRRSGASRGARRDVQTSDGASHVVRARGGDGRTSSASILRRTHRGGRRGRHGDARMGRRRRRRRRRRVVSRARIRGTGSVDRRAQKLSPGGDPDARRDGKPQRGRRGRDTHVSHATMTTERSPTNREGDTRFEGRPGMILFGSRLWSARECTRAFVVVVVVKRAVCAVLSLVSHCSSSGEPRRRSITPRERPRARRVFVAFT